MALDLPFIGIRKGFINTFPLVTFPCRADIVNCHFSTVGAHKLHRFVNWRESVAHRPRAKENVVGTPGSKKIENFLLMRCERFADVE